MPGDLWKRFLDSVFGFARNDSENMNERYMKWYTPWPSREFEMLVFGNGGGLPVII